MFVNTVLVCNGVTDVSDLLSRNMLMRMSDRFDEEQIAKHKEKLKGKIKGIRMDGKQCPEEKSLFEQAKELFDN